jgi:chemotaxis signal transduction protein
MQPDLRREKFAAFDRRGWSIAISVGEVAELKTDESIKVAPVRGAIVIGFIYFKGDLCPIVELSHLIGEPQDPEKEINELRSRAQAQPAENVLIVAGRNCYVGFPLDARPRIVNLDREQLVRSEKALGRIPMPFLQGLARMEHSSSSLTAVLSLRDYLDSASFVALKSELKDAD